MVTEKISNSDGVEAYLQAQTPEHADICRHLVAEIRHCLPKVNTKTLRRLLKQAGKEIWDFASIRKQRAGIARIRSC